MSSRRLVLCVLLGAFPWIAADASAQDEIRLRAVISTPTRYVSVGKPVWVDFTLQNLAAEDVALIVPGTQSETAAGPMGLPLSHVFSGRAYAGLVIEGEHGRRWDVAVDYHPPDTTELVTIAPFGSVGVSFDVTRYYPMLRSPGRYRLAWEPYGGRLVSNELLIEVSPRKQVVLLTDLGEMTIELSYDEAPRHVENFLELAQSGFYDNLTFHKIWPGTFIQGGCPLGNGTGIRSDGKKLAPEFSDLPQERGAVSMARLESDPDSASCQFFICNTRIPEWDGRYTVFGHLIGEEAYETLDKLMSTPVDDQGRAERRVYIRGLRIEDAPSTESGATLSHPTVLVPYGSGG